MDLANRLSRYYRNSELENKSPKLINRSLLKYGHNNFALEILEYCPLDKLLEREQFYFDTLKPEYNILKHAYSMLGFKHTPENIAKFKLKTVSPEHRSLISLKHAGKTVSPETKEKLAIATTRHRTEKIALCLLKP